MTKNKYKKKKPQKDNYLLLWFIVVITTIILLFFNCYNKNNILIEKEKTKKKQKLEKERTYNFEINYTIENKKINFIEQWDYINTLRYSINQIPLEFNSENKHYFSWHIKENLSQYIAENLISNEKHLEDFNITINRLILLNSISANLKKAYLLIEKENLCWKDSNFNITTNAKTIIIDNMLPENIINSKNQHYTISEKLQYFEPIKCK